MKTHSKLYFPVALFGFCVSAAFYAVSVFAASPTTPAGPYTLVIKFAVGQVRNYTLSADIAKQIAVSGRTQQVNIHLDMTDTATIEAVRGSDGVATSHIVFTTVDGILNGQPMSPDIMSRTKIWPFTAVETPNGRILTMTPDPGQPANATSPDASAYMNATFLPITAVNIGDTWSGALPVGATGTMLSLRSDLQSVSSVSGATVAKIDTVTSMAPTINNGQSPSTKNPPTLQYDSMNGEMHTDFDMTAGVIVRISGLTTTVATMSAPGANGAQTPVQVTSVSKILMTLLPNNRD
jgi:hypothetical protein